MSKRFLFIALIIFVIVIPVVLLLFPNKKNPSPAPFSPTPTQIVNPPEHGPLGITVQNTTPSNNSTDVDINQKITVTLNKPATLDQIAINVFPNVPYTTSIDGNNLIITPQTPLQPGTTYSYILKYADTTESDRYSFTTAGPANLTPTTIDNATQMEDENDRIRHPDVFLSNRTPYETADFSVTNDFSSTPADHFYFTVTSKTSNGKQAFLDWLKSLNLGYTQMQQLDIRYQ